MFFSPKTPRVKGSWIVSLNNPNYFSIPGFPAGPETRVHENQPVLVKKRFAAETHSDWKFKVGAAHRVLKVFIKCSVRPIIYRAIPV